MVLAVISNFHIPKNVLRIICDKLLKYIFFLFTQVDWSVYMYYAKAVGLPYAFLILFFYGIYQILSVWASIWLSNWTSDPRLQDLDLLPGNSSERRELNEYYLGIYGLFGVATSKITKVLDC